MPNFDRRKKTEQQRDTARAQNAVQHLTRVVSQEQRWQAAAASRAPVRDLASQPNAGWKKEWKRLVRDGECSAAPDGGTDEQAWLQGGQRCFKPSARAVKVSERAEVSPALPELALPSAPTQTSRGALVAYVHEVQKTLAQAPEVSGHQLRPFMREFVNHLRQMTATAPPGVRTIIADLLKPAWDVRTNAEPAGVVLSHALSIQAVSALSLHFSAPISGTLESNPDKISVASDGTEEVT